MAQHFVLYKEVSVIKFLLVFVWMLSGLSSCLSTKITKKQDYFKDLKKDTIISGIASREFENKIQVGDKLLIEATSLNPLEDGIFNQGGAEAGESAGKAYLVRANGIVLLHRLGEVKVDGLTRYQLATKLQRELAAYMKDVIVAVSFANHKVTVMGAVGTPQVISMKDEQMSIIEAIVLSGDVTDLGKIDEVLVIREQGNTKEVKRLNLQKSSILQSDWYYLKPNDIVFIPKDDSLALEEEKRKKQDNLRNTVSFVASGISLLVLILSIIIK